MPVQRSQGRLRPLVPRADELPAGVPAPAGSSDPATAAALAGVQRTPDGLLADAESARVLGRLGGLAKAERERQLAECPRLARGLGLRDVTADELRQYLTDADDFAAVECARLARDVGRGKCDLGPASIVQSAALQLAASRLEFARGNLLNASRLADASRANLLAAHELCALAAGSNAGLRMPLNIFDRKPDD